MTVGDSQERDLEVLLSYLLNRQLKQGEVIVALGISRSTYYDQKNAGKLANAENLLTAATYFGLNPLDLLAHYSLITLEQVRDFLERNSEHPIVATKKGGLRTGAKPRQHLGPAV
jgi:hypothetical protein